MMKFPDHQGTISTEVASCYQQLLSTAAVTIVKNTDDEVAAHQSTLSNTEVASKSINSYRYRKINCF